MLGVPQPMNPPDRADNLQIVQEKGTGLPEPWACDTSD